MYGERNEWKGKGTKVSRKIYVADKEIEEMG